VWSPLKPLVYALPMFSLLALLWFSNKREGWRRIIALSLSYVICCCLYAFFYPEFYAKGALLTFITYSGGFFLLSLPSQEMSLSEDTFQKVLLITTYFILFQGVLGIAEALYGYGFNGSFDLANGDWVKGSIGLSLRGLFPGVDGSNTMYAANMGFSLLAVKMLKGNQKLKFLALSAGIGGLVLSSVMHIIVFYVIAIFFSSLIYIIIRFRAKKKHLLQWAIAIVFTLFLTFLLLEQNSMSLKNLASRSISNRAPVSVSSSNMEIITTPRQIVLERIQGPMMEKYPYLPYFGLGPGQFSSTGALIATGLYFGSPVNPKHLPFLNTHLTPSQEEFFIDQWYRQAENNLFGSLQAPYFPWLNIFVEFGALGVVFVLVVFSCLFADAVKSLFQCRFDGDQFIAFCSLLIFFALLGCQGSYWGVPQASFLGLVLLKILQAKSGAFSV
jgi:hypothetical protein